MVSNNNDRYRIGCFILDLSAGYLQNRNGKPVHLRNQTYRVLALFAKHGNQLLERQQIIEMLWKDRFVTDDSLTQCVKEIRQALRDHDRTLLQTVHRSGYRLMCDDEEDPDAAYATMTQMVNFNYSDRVNPFPQHWQANADTVVVTGYRVNIL